MSQVVGQIRQLWTRSRAYRVILVIAIVYVAFRLTVQGIYIGTMLSPESALGGVKPEGSMVPIDLQVYLDAARHFQEKQDLYLDSLELIEYHFPYPPAYAMAFTLFLWLSPTGASIIHTLLHIIAYVALYVCWSRIFHQTGLDQANKKMASTLPVWLIFPVFWSDLGYLNIYIIMALLSTLLIHAVLNEYLSWSLVWLSLILQTKPMWAFAAAVPLLLGRYRFFFKLVALAIPVYVAIAGVTILVAGPSYGWEQYTDYAHLLARLGDNFPWRELDNRFLGYNHSIKQIIIYLLGEAKVTKCLANGIKTLLLLPLLVISLRCIFQSPHHVGQKISQVSLEIAFVLYLGAFIWLDIVWEVSLGIVVFTYLLATLEQQWSRALVWGTFLLYTLVDPLRTLGAILTLFGLNTILPGPYITTDFSMYFPIVMVVILAFYGLLLKRLWDDIGTQSKGQARTGGWQTA